MGEAQERELGRQTQLQTLSEYSGRILAPNSSVTKRVRKVATRIIEASNLGKVKSGHDMGAVEGKVASWGGGGEDGAMQDVLFGRGNGNVDSQTEWEVSRPSDGIWVVLTSGLRD